MIDQLMSFFYRSPSKADLREMLAEAMRNTEAKKTAAIAPPIVPEAIDESALEEMALALVESVPAIEEEREPEYTAPSDSEMADILRLSEIAKKYKFVVTKTGQLKPAPLLSPEVKVGSRVVWKEDGLYRMKKRIKEFERGEQGVVTRITVFGPGTPNSVTIKFGSRVDISNIHDVEVA